MNKNNLYYHPTAKTENKKNENKDSMLSSLISNMGKDICQDVVKKTDINVVGSTEQLVDAAKKRFYNLEKELGSKNFWPFLMLLTAVPWMLAYAMFGFMDIPVLKGYNIPWWIKFVIGLIAFLVLCWIVLQAKKSYYDAVKQNQPRINLKNCWLILKFFSAVLWFLAFTMISFLNIPLWKLLILPIAPRLFIGVISFIAGYWVMLQARDNYYYIRWLKKEINKADIVLQDYLYKYEKEKIKKTVMKKEE